MKDDNLGEERDPLLVRPYLLHDSGTTPADDESSQTWPAATTRDAPGRRALSGLDEPTAVLALPAAPERRHVRPARRRLVLLSVVGAVVALVVGVAGLAALTTGEPPVTALPAAPLPAATGPQTASAEASAGNDDAPATTAAATPGTTAGGGRATSATRGPGAGTTTKATAGTPQTAVKPAVPGGEQVATPTAGRTGAIRGQNGVCLDGSSPFDRDHVQVSRCDGSGAQTFTLAGDGTLRVDGKCAEVDGDGSVQTDDCGSRGTAKWRIDGQLLIETASGRCLTDPFGLTHISTRVMVLACGGSARQRWSLP